MLKPSGIIFDLDGVLWHSNDAHAAAYERAFHEAGIRLPRGFYEVIAGETTQAGIARLLTDFAPARAGDAKLRDRLRKRKQSLAAVELAHVEPDPEALPALQALGACGYKLALATSASRATMTLFLRRLSEPDVFAATICGEDVRRGKPAPDIFIEAARRLGLAAGACVVVEDSRSGIRAALAAGMGVIGFRLGEHTPDERLLARCQSLSAVGGWLALWRDEVAVGRLR